MDAQIIAKLQGIAKAEGWPALLLLTPENVAYALGFVVPSQPLMRWRHAVCIVPAEGAPSLLVVDMETTTIRDHLPDVELFTYNEFTDRPMETLAKALASLGLDNAPLGIELDYLSANDAAALRRHLPNVRWEGCERQVAAARTIKTPAELETLRRLSHLTDDTIYHALTSVRAGLTEMDIAAGLTAGLFERGADQLKLLIVASGDRSGYPNVGPSQRVLRPGDLVRTEIFGVQRGYHAGVCRTAIVGQPDAEMERVWSVLAECRRLVLDRVKPGASAAAIYRDVLEKFTAAGLQPISFVGHGIGVHLHEDPYLGRYGDSTLQAGMVLGIEPLVYTPGRGMQIKDIVAVTADGCEVLSNACPGDELIPIPL